jgi:CheY-like chemotaxis protein
MINKNGSAGNEIGPLAVLVVNDNPMLLQLFKEILEKDGHSVTAICGALKEIEAALEQGNVDLLIADIETHSRNGHRAAAALTKRPGLRVLYITGTSENLGARLDPEERVTLKKPFSPSELLASIRLVMETTGEPLSRTGEPSFADRPAPLKQRSSEC